MAKRKDFWFKSSNGKTMIHGVKWIPNDGGYKAILQISHGMCEHIMRYDEFACYMADHGFLVVGHDHAGHGKSAKSPDDYGYFGKHPSNVLVADMHKVRQKTQKEGKPYFMLAHSMGSYMLRKYLAIHGSGVSAAVVMGTGYIAQPVINFGIAVAKLQGLVMGKKHRSELLRKLSYSKSYAQFDSYGNDYTKSWLMKDVNEVEKYFNDSMCTFTFTCNGYLGLFEAVKHSCKRKNATCIPKELPILLVSGTDDPVGDLGVGVKKVEKLYKSVGLENVECKLYENDRHEILHETDRKQVFEDILAYLVKQI